MTHAYPVLSVVVAVRNASAYLDEAISSILTQTIRDVELILVNDGSDDRSADILDEWRERDDRITVLTLGKVGISNAVNAGVAVSCGSLIARMDADDIALPNRLETQLRYMEHNSDCVALGAAVLQIDPEGLPISPLAPPTKHEQIVDELFRGRGSALIQPVVMIRRDALHLAGGYDPRFAVCEDLDLYLRLAEIGRLANLNDTLLKYRRHRHSTSAATRDDDVLRIKQAILTEAYLRLGSPEARPSLIKCFQPRTPTESYAVWALKSLSAGNVRTTRKYVAKLIAECARHPLRAARSYAHLLVALLTSAGKQFVRRHDSPEL